MIEFNIVNKNNKYQVFSEQGLIFTALRKGFLGGDKVYFYDTNNNLIVYSIQRYLFMFDFGHKIKFTADNHVYYLKRHKASQILKYRDGLYEIKFGLLHQKPEFFFNGQVCGRYDLTKSSIGEFECKVICNDENLCRIFTVIQIVLDWFDVN